MSNEDQPRTPGDWFNQASRDWQQVDERLEEGECADAAFLLQQSVENYLKGYLVSKDWEPKHIHDVGDLLEEVIRHNSNYSFFRDLCKEISEYYFFEWNPSPSKVPSKERLKEVLQQAGGLVGKMSEEVKL